MLFNSYIFILVFLPLVLFGYFKIGKHNHKYALLWLLIASLFFYGWWNVNYVGLLLASITFNFVAGGLVARSVDSKPRSYVFLTIAISVNLAFLFYFKYANFFIESANQIASTAISIEKIILPLGISFFTFTQIAFLVDTYQRKVKEIDYIQYAIFVTYFPHLIAGPVLHHGEMMPQFSKPSVSQINYSNVAIGMTIFLLGLIKKVFIADSLATFATPVFEIVKSGGQPMLFDAWIGVLAYTFQLYFDFSAYSDMAIGLSFMFNVRLPLNFNSPYKATSIIEFWRCWHMTLSRFLRDYLYIPLGGNRSGPRKRYLNLMITMILGGLWHGAGWTFLVWGGLHGAYLLINHAWRNLKKRMNWRNGGNFSIFCAGALTFLVVLIAWVFFRADSFDAAFLLLRGLTGGNGISLPPGFEGWYTRLFPGNQLVVFNGLSQFNILNSIAVLSASSVIVWLTPNMWQIFERYKPVCDDVEELARGRIFITDKIILGAVERFTKINPSAMHYTVIFPAVLAGLISILILIAIGSNRSSEFLYFQF